MREAHYRSSSHRSRHKSRSKSRDRDRDRERERDRDYYSRRRRSTSRSRHSKSKKKKSKKKRYRSSSNSSTSSRSRGSLKSSVSSIRRTQPPSSEDNSLSVHTNRDIHVLNDFPDPTAINKIEEDSFTAKPFISSKESKKVTDKVIIDLKNDTILVEQKDDDTQPQESLLFHPDFIGDDRTKMDRWVKKLFNYRQKAFQE